MVIPCHKCGHPVEVAADQFGATVQCPTCGEQINTGEPRPMTGPPLHAAYRRPLRTCSMAITSLVSGILGLVLSFVICGLGALGSIAAIVCGHVACAQIRKEPDVLGGRGLAVAGLVLGYIGMVAALVGGIWLGLLFSMFSLSAVAPPPAPVIVAVPTTNASAASVVVPFPPTNAPLPGY
jgi:hypothetical protein